MNKEIHISYNKTKLLLVMVGCLFFIVVGIMTLLDEDGMTSIMYRSELRNKTIAICAIIFFGAIFITIPIKVFHNKMGLIINEQGIIDNSNFSSIGLIEWQDIKGIRLVDFNRTKALVIDTHKPKKYLDKANSSFKKRMLNSNKKIYGTPLYITSLILNIKCNDLNRILMEAYNKKQTTHQQGA